VGVDVLSHGFGRSRPLITTIAVALVFATAAGAPAATAAQAEHVTLTLGSAGQVTVHWTATSINGVREWQVVLEESDADGHVVHWLFAPPKARSVVVSNLPAGAAVRAAVGVFTGRRDVAPSRLSDTVVTTRGTCAGISGDCIAIDATSAAGPVRHVAQGFLHGLTFDTTGRAEAKALSPTTWRVAEGLGAESSALRGIPTRTIAVLSDAWWRETHGRQPYAASPWSNWSAYRAFVRREVRNREASGTLPTYWEVQNEPDVLSHFDPRAPATSARLLTLYAVAYHAIVAELPHAKVVGPSIGSYLLRGDKRYLGLLDFIDFATRHQLRYAAVSWHELHAGDPRVPSLQLPTLADRVEMVRTALRASPVLARAQILVDEYGSAWSQPLVGWDLGHVIALEQAGVDGADRSCWSGCGSNDVLDSLLSTDGHTPRITYWGRRAYAQMSGRFLAAVSSRHDTSVLAGGNGDSVTALIARHQLCTTGRSSCVAGSRLLTITIRFTGGGNGRAKVVLTPLPATSTDQRTPPPSLPFTVRVVDGVAVIKVPAIANNAALVVSASRS
jgi:hypothetical protein